MSISEQRKGRTPCPPLVGMTTISIADQVSRLKNSPEWGSRDRHSVGLVRNPPLNLMLMVLKQGARLPEHRTYGPIALQVVSGSIRFVAGAERVVCAGELIALDRNISHSLEALAESVIILTTVLD